MPLVIANDYLVATIIPYNKINMYKTIKRSALSINICFSLVIALGALAFLGTYTASHASTTRSYCQRQYNLSFQQKLLPVAHKRCSSEFEIITREWKTGQYNNSLQK